jgi:hypothetical protein
MLKSSVPESSILYTCKCCLYNTSRLSQYNRHVLTAKHKKLEISTDFNNLSTDFNKKSSKFECQCGKVYKERTGLWRHKKVCEFEELITEEESEEETEKEVTDKELIIMLIKQNSQLIEKNNDLVEKNIEIFKNINSTNNSHNNNTTNSHNKAFNLNFFLNETCKDAMNIMDFVDSIKLQLSDLEKVGELGYVDGISNIIVKNLKELDVNKRPVHCTDKKRETMYIKDENKWEKEEEDKKKLRRAIKRVAFKNQNLIQDFKKENPDYNKYHSKMSDKYNKIIVESMGGSGNNDHEKEDKIIKNISNVSIINNK